MNATREQWRAIPGYEGIYEVSDQGRVRSLDRFRADGNFQAGRVLAPVGRTQRYWTVSLHRDCKRTFFRIQHLVMLAFVGPRPKGMVIRHLNGIGTDNRLGNLKYGTHSENAYDRVRHGTNRNAAKTHCRNGHEFTPENTLVRGDRNYRGCRTCTRQQQKKHTARKDQLGRQRAQPRENTADEKWLPVVGFEGLFSVSDQGRVRGEERYARCVGGKPGNMVESRRLVRQRMLSQNLSSGYPRVALGQYGRERVHVLVAEAFIGPRPEGMYVRHLNDDPLDNWLENLAYGTPEQNQNDRYVNEARRPVA